MKFRSFNFVMSVAGVAVLVSAAILLWLAPRDVKIEKVFFEGAKGRIVGELYRIECNECKNEKSPAVVICHGVENNKEAASHLAIEFARAGFVALAFDYGGYGESFAHNDNFELMVADTMAAIHFIAKIPEVDANAIALVGHSMGVSYAVAAAESGDVNIVSVVGLGNEAIANSVPPRNLLLAMGLYDAFHTQKNMLSAVRESANNPNLAPGDVAGNYALGTARSLYVSPLSDHGMEPFDPILIAEAIRWTLHSSGFDDPGDRRFIKETYRAEARLAFIVASIIFLIAFFFSLFLKYKKISVIRYPIVFIIPILIAGNFVRPSIAYADVSFILLIAGSIAAYLSRSMQNPALAESEELSFRKFLFGAAFIGAVAVSLLAGLLIHGLPVALTRIKWAIAVPQFVFHIVFLRPYEGLCMLRAYAFQSYSIGLMPEFWFAVVLLIELIQPGSITLLVSKIVGVVVKAFRFRGAFKLQSSAKSSAAFAVALVGLAVILWRRFSEGWLSGESVKLMAVIAIKFLIVPLIIFIFILNLPFFNAGSRDDAAPRQ